VVDQTYFFKKILNKNNTKNFRERIIGNVLYIVTVVLIISWAIGFFAYSGGAVIHLLHVIVVIAFLVKFISGRKSVAYTIIN